MLFDDRGRCVVCGLHSAKSLCTKHIKSYRFVKKYGFYALKPRRGVSKPQTALFKVVRGLYKKPTYQEVIFEFNMYRRYDIVVPDLKLELEYDGIQHFKFVRMFHHTKKRFEDMKTDEIIKESNLKGHGYNVIRFSYIEDVNDVDYVRKKLKLKGF